MSSQYENIANEEVWRASFKVSPAVLPTDKLMRARRVGGFIRARKSDLISDVADVEALANHASINVPEPAEISTKKPQPIEREWVTAQWGLIPHWVKSASDARLRAAKNLIARNESVSTTQAFRDAWLTGQRCIVPMQAFIVDDLRTGKPVPTRIARTDGQPFGVAGVWSSWINPESGLETLSYALLTINANSHALMHRYQHPGSEKRMLAILGEGTYDSWLSAKQEKAREFMRAYPANWLTANPKTT